MAKWKAHQASSTDYYKSQVSSMVLEPVNVNTCTREEQLKIPNISTSQVNALIAKRAGGTIFHTYDDLRCVTGVGAKTIKLISPFIKFETRRETEPPPGSSQGSGSAAAQTPDPEFGTAPVPELSAHFSRQKPQSRKDRRSDYGPVNRVRVALYQGLTCRDGKCHCTIGSTGEVEAPPRRAPDAPQK